MTKKTHKILLQCHSLVYFYMGLGAIYSKYPNEKLEIDVIITGTEDLIHNLRKKIKLSKYINKTYVINRDAFKYVNKKIYKLKKNFFNKIKYHLNYKKKILKILHKNIKQKKYDDFVFCHESASNIIAYIKYLSPKAHCIMYGDGAGLIMDKYTKSVNPYNKYRDNLFIKPMIPDEIVALAPYKQEETFDTSNLPISATDPQILRKVIEEDSLIQKEVKDFYEEVFSKYKDCKYKTALLTTKLELDCFNMSDEDQINIYLDMIEKYCPEGSLVILKLHPTSTKPILELIKENCKKDYKIVAIPDNLKDYAIEIFADLITNLDSVITFQSSATISLKILYNTKTINAYDVLQKYPVKERINPILEMFQAVIDKYNSWDKKSIIVEYDTISAIKSFHDKIINSNKL